MAGHASAGNLHFMLTPKFSEAAERDRYEAFMAELVDLIVDKYDGSLKAEHGTGINMAPYVEREWGPKATELMWRVKRLADPDGLLAPGVVLNRDPGVHLRNLKTTPPIEEVADTCVECGFCEPVCPSRLLTTTPRQRIALRREMARQPSGSPLQRVLLDEYEYDGIETCAADGSCMLACPVGIDTGKLIKGFREAEHGPRAERTRARRQRSAGAPSSEPLAAGCAPAERLPGRLGMRRCAAPREPPGASPAGSWFRSGARRCRGRPSRRFQRRRARGRRRSTCPPASTASSALRAPSRTPRACPKPWSRVSERAGLPVWIPPDVAGSCCGTPWASKGYRDGHGWMANRIVERLWGWSDEGALPTVIDASSCTHALLDEVPSALGDDNRERHGQLEVIDAVSWARDQLVPRLAIRGKLGSVTVHPTCGGRHVGLDRSLRALAGELADEVHVPPSATCCGFAGDRGFLHPELTEAATLEEAAEIRSGEFDAYVSSNRTCEIGLERATGEPYVHVVQLLEKLTR